MHVSPHTVEVNVAISKRLYRAIKKSPTHRGPDTAAKVKVGGEIAALVFNAVEFSTYHDSSKPGSRYAAGIRIPLPMRPFNDIKSGAIKAENLDMETTKVAIMGRRMVFKAWRDPNYEAPTTAKDDGSARDVQERSGGIESEQSNANELIYTAEDEIDADGDETTTAADAQH